MRSVLAGLAIMAITKAAGAEITWTQAVGKCVQSDGGKTSFGVKPEIKTEAACAAECGYGCDAWRLANDATRDKVCVLHNNKAGAIAGGDGDAEEGTCNIKSYPAVNYEGTYTSAVGCCEQADGKCVASKGSDLRLNTSQAACEAWCNTEYYCHAYAHMGFNNLCTIMVGHTEETKAVQAVGGSPPPMTCYLRDDIPEPEPAACSDWNGNKKGCKLAEGLDCTYDKFTKTCSGIVLEGCAVYDSPDTCNDVAGCRFKKGRCKGTPSTATGCARYRKNKRKCKVAGCTYLKPDCVDAVLCSLGNGSKKTCKSINGCGWNKVNKTCFSK